MRHILFSMSCCHACRFRPDRCGAPNCTSRLGVPIRPAGRKRLPIGCWRTTPVLCWWPVSRAGAKPPVPTGMTVDGVDTTAAAIVRAQLRRVAIGKAARLRDLAPTRFVT